MINLRKSGCEEAGPLGIRRVNVEPHGCAGCSEWVDIRTVVAEAARKKGNHISQGRARVGNAGGVRKDSIS